MRFCMMAPLLFCGRAAALHFDKSPLTRTPAAAISHDWDGLEDMLSGSQNQSRATKGSVCKGGDLQVGDGSGVEMASQTRAIWGKLFERWHNKKVLLAGDSLMEQFYDTLKCTAELMGGTIEQGNVGKYNWGSEDAVFYEDTSSGPPMSGSTTANRGVASIIFRTEAQNIKPQNREFHIRVHYYRLYAFTEKCRHCDSHRPSNAPPVECGGFCAIEKALKSRTDTLAEFARHYDVFVTNLGHDMLSAGDVVVEKVNRVVESLCEEAEEHNVKGKLILMEHPANHYPGGPDGNKQSADHKTYTSCECNLPRLDDQSVAQNNAAMERAAKEHGVPVAKIWHRMAEQCDKHNPPDCTHFKHSPTVWMPVADEIMKVS